MLLEDAYVHRLFVHAGDISGTKSQRLQVTEIHLLFHVFNIGDLLVVEHILLVLLLLTRPLVIARICLNAYKRLLHCFVLLLVRTISFQIVDTRRMNVQILEAFVKK